MKQKSIEIIRTEIRDIEAEIKTLEAQLKLKHKEKKKLIRAMEQLQRKSKKDLQVPPQYSKDLSWKEKIAYAIDKLKISNVEQIADKISRLEPKLERENIYATIQRTIVRMVNEGDVIKKGKYKSTYELNIH